MMKTTLFPRIEYDQYDHGLALLQGNRATLYQTPEMKQVWTFEELIEGKRPMGQLKEYLDLTAITFNERFVALGSSSKFVYIFDKQNEMKQIGSVKVKKRVGKLILLSHQNGTSTLYIVDLSGLVHSVKIPDTLTPQVVLGHVSSVIDADMSKDGRYIFTADRDNKLRVTAHPRTENIVAFCMGHTKGLSSVASVMDRYVVSSSFDHTIRLWDFEGNTHFPTSYVLPLETFPIKIVPISQNRIVVAYEKQTYLDIYQLQAPQLNIKHLERLHTKTEICDITVDQREETKIYVLHHNSNGHALDTFILSSNSSPSLVTEASPIQCECDVDQERAYLSNLLEKEH